MFIITAITIIFLEIFFIKAIDIFTDILKNLNQFVEYYGIPRLN